MSTYRTDNLPSHAEFFEEKYPGFEIEKISGLHGDMWFGFQDGVVLFLEVTNSPKTRNGGALTFKMKLGKTKWGPYYGENLVRSEEVELTGIIESNNVGDKHRAVKEMLVEEGFGRTDSIYEDFVSVFGEDAIRKDEREEN